MTRTKPGTPASRYLRRREAAEQLGVSERTLDRWIKGLSRFHQTQMVGMPADGRATPWGVCRTGTQLAHPSRFPPYLLVVLPLTI